MKPKSLVFLSLMATLLACENKDNQLLGNKVAGTWTIEKIRFSYPYRLDKPNTPGTDSVAILNGATITFDPCTFKGETYVNCPGSYQIVGKKKTLFMFMAYGKNSNNIQIPSIRFVDKGEFRLNGGYDLAFGDKGRLDMKGYLALVDSSEKTIIYDPNAYLTLVRP